jgi:hypothetical protein
MICRYTPGSFRQGGGYMGETERFYHGIMHIRGNGVLVRACGFDVFQGAVR